MPEDELVDRRRSGVYTARVKNGAGAPEDRLIINVKKWRGYLGLITAFAAVVAVLFGLVRFGAQYEVKDEIDKALAQPTGVIYRAMEDCANAHMGELDRELDQRFDRLESDMKVVQEQQKVASEERKRQHEELMRVIRGGR